MVEQRQISPRQIWNKNGTVSIETKTVLTHLETVLLHRKMVLNLQIYMVLHQYH